MEEDWRSEEGVDGPNISGLDTTQGKTSSMWTLTPPVDPQIGETNTWNKVRWVKSGFERERGGGGGVTTDH